MNPQNRIRTQLLIAGAGLALLFTSGARAQEISNTQFADGPYTEPLTQPVPANPESAASTDSQAANSSATASAVVHDAGNARSEQSYASDRIMWIGVAFVWIGAVGMYFVRLPKQLVLDALLKSMGDAR